MKFSYPIFATAGLGFGLLLIGGCATPSATKTTAVPSPSVQSPPVAVVTPPPAEILTVDLKAIPRQTFGGIFQDNAPQPLWTIEHYNPLGQPDISPDGRWLVLNRAEGKEGKVLVLADLANRTVAEHKVAAPGVVSQAVFSRDSRELLAVVNTPAGHAFARWSLPSMTLTVKHLASGEAIAAAFTHAQDQAVVMRADGMIGVFNLATGVKRFDVSFQQGTANFYYVALAVSPDDQFVSSGVIHPGNEYVRWRLADGARVETPAQKEHLAWGRPAAATRDGKTIFVAAHHELLAINSATGERRATYPGNGLNTLHYQPTVDLIAAPIGNAQTFGLVDGTTGQMRFWAKHAARPPAEYGYVNWAAVSPDGKTAYSADYFSIKAWDLSRLNARGPDWLFTARYPRTLLPPARGDSLMAVGETVDTWNLTTRRLMASQPSWLLRHDRAGDRDEWRTGRGTVAVWRTGDTLRALRLDDEGAQIYDVASEQPLLRLGTPKSKAAGEVAPATQAVWQTPSSYTRTWPETFPYQGGYLQADASPDGRRLVVTTWDGSQPCVTLWDLETGRRLAVLADGQVGARIARFSFDGKSVVVATAFGGIAIFDIGGGKEPTMQIVSYVSSYGGNQSAPGDVIMPTRDRVYIGTQNGQLRSWHHSDTLSWYARFVHRINDANTSAEFPAPVTRLAASPSGRTLAVALFNAANEGSILIIDTESGAIRARLDDHVSDLCFLDEHTLATTGIRIWNLDEFLAKAPAHVP